MAVGAHAVRPFLSLYILMPDLPIGLAAVFHAVDGDRLGPVIYFIQDAVFAEADAVAFLMAQFQASRRPGVCAEMFDARVHPAEDFQGQGVELARGLVF